MNSVNISQSEAERLISLEKHAIKPSNDNPINLPERGGAISLKLESADKKEEFSFDIRRGSIDLGKFTNQTRTRRSIILVRLDIGGAPHRNPDDQEIPKNHIHL